MASLTELDLARQIRDLARQFGWLHVHFRPAKTAHGWRTPVSGDYGFPDVVLARDGRVIFAELKRDGQKARPEQLAWLEQLGGGACEAYLWTPSDFEQIVELLR